MKNRTYIAIGIGVGNLLFALYAFNGVKFFNCNFESDYKCEVIHGIGLAIPPAALVTVWFDDYAEK